MYGITATCIFMAWRPWISVHSTPEPLHRMTPQACTSIWNANTAVTLLYTPMLIFKGKRRNKHSSPTNHTLASSFMGRVFAYKLRIFYNSKPVGRKRSGWVLSLIKWTVHLIKEGRPYEIRLIYSFKECVSVQVL